jgi:hypothetical protein
MSSQIDLALNEAPKRRPRYSIGKEDTMQPKILAKPFFFYGSVSIFIQTNCKYKQRSNKTYQNNKAQKLLCIKTKKAKQQRNQKSKQD